MIINTLKEATIDNPLLSWRWKRSSAYTWPNLLLLVGLMLVAITSCVRFQIWWVCYRLSAPYQFDQKLYEAISVMRTSHEYLSFYERLAAFYQLQGFMLILGVMGLYLVPDLPGLGRFQRQRMTDEIRILPLTVRQVVLAYNDWPFLKCLLVLAIGFVFALLPARRIWDYTIIGFLFRTSGAYHGDSIWEWLCCVDWVLTPAVMILALHRTLLLLGWGQWHVFWTRCLPGWIGWLVLSFVKILFQDSAWETLILLIIGSWFLLRCCMVLPKGLFEKMQSKQVEGGL